MEIISISILSILLVFFHFFADPNSPVTTNELFAGLSNQALISVITLLILGQAIIQTGALNNVSDIILKVSFNNSWLAIILSLIMVVVISAFMNNTPVVIMFIPILNSLVKSVGMSPGKIMIPLSYAAILGGMLTLLGSSTNLLVSAIIVDFNLEPLSFFSFAYPGMFLVIVGMLYIFAISHKLLPNNSSDKHQSYEEINENREFISQMVIKKESELVGKVINSEEDKVFDNLQIRMIERGDQVFIFPYHTEVIIQAGDILIFSLTKENIKKSITASNHYLKDIINSDNLEGNILAEIVIPPNSNMINKMVSNHNFNNLKILGIQRNIKNIKSKIDDVVIKSGDVLLVAGKKEDVYSVSRNLNIMILEIANKNIGGGRSSKIAGLTFVLVAMLSAFNILPISVSATMGITILLLTKTLTKKQLTYAIDMNIIMLIVTSIALGVAMSKTGGAEYLAHQFVVLMKLVNAPNIVIMSVLFFIIAILTNILSNNSTAVLFTPIAINLAVELNAPIEMYIYTVIFACNCSFITPIGYQTNLLVMSPGNYKFNDYIKVGLPLTVLIWFSYTVFCIVNPEFFYK